MRHRVIGSHHIFDGFDNSDSQDICLPGPLFYLWLLKSWTMRKDVTYDTVTLIRVNMLNYAHKTCPVPFR